MSSDSTNPSHHNHHKHDKHHHLHPHDANAVALQLHHNKQTNPTSDGHHGHHHPAAGNCTRADIEHFKCELDLEKKTRNDVQAEYVELKRQMDEFQCSVEESKLNPISKYDPLITKQSYFNDTLSKQICDAKEKLKNLSQSLKHIQVCGKDCDIHMRDLLIDYNCITKGELTKEIKRFQRMQIDLKSNLDRLQWRLDCESKDCWNEENPSAVDINCHHHNHDNHHHLHHHRHQFDH